jgi:hypothetical protein
MMRKSCISMKISSRIYAQLNDLSFVGKSLLESKIHPHTAYQKQQVKNNVLQSKKRFP